MSADAWLVVGLGNPGPGYAAHRHNVGEMVVEELGKRTSANFKRHRANAMVAEVRSPAGRMILAGTNTYMNLSGGPVAGLLKYYKLGPERLVVVHDELDIPFDSVRLKLGGGPGGHNGIRDIIAAVGTGDFIRVRVGIGRPPGRQDAAGFVLSNFSSTEKQSLPNLLADAADAVEAIVADGLTSAQQRFHSPA
ncbi:aminoacyl-tRNA hydrolase [Cryobacterium sp. BB736]|uniref:aminoacyl-tRNA hydrolase n=1 Tax=Cryobacterium sp. BB736 TaxID=2746963 RepID=UPI001873CD3D|nr:aminoacyl-tRNA hydrolase [Cryobacterium sp. BB736]